MGMMTLGLANGEELTVTTEGTDEQEALNGLDRFLSNVG
jgi:catabolite repression HPr-like protein